MLIPQIRGLYALFLVALSAYVLFSPAHAQTSVPYAEMVLGDANAPVTVIEYVSLTCPHCAAFHEKTFPQMKTQYIDTGKVRFIVRDYPLDRAAFHAAILARCAGAERYFSFLDVLFKQQDSWSLHKDPLLALTMLGGLGGVTEEKFRACLDDEELSEKVLGSRLEAHERYDITSTPSFLINGVKHSGDLPFVSLEALLRPLLEAD